MHRREQIFSFVSVLLSPLNDFRICTEFLKRSVTGSFVQRATASCEEKVLGPVFFVNLIFVRKIVTDRIHMEVAGLDQRLDRLYDRRLERSLLVLIVPGCLLFEVLRVLR